MIRPALALSLLLSTAAAAQITAFGNLGTGTTTWSGTVTVTGDVTVPAGGTLVIQPGTVVTANATDSQGSGDVSTKPELLIFGVLNVSGVNGGGVTFTGAGTGTTAWGGIVVRAGGSATLSYATLDEMSAGIKAELGGASVTTSLTISNSTVSGSEYGVRTLATGSGGALTTTLTDVTFSGVVQNALWHAAGAMNVTGSSLSGGTSGYALYQSGGTLSLTTTRITNNVYAVYIDGGTSSAFDRCTLANNTSTSPALDTYVSSGTTTVTSSIISGNGGFGVRRGYLGSISVTSSNVWGNSNTFGPPPTASANSTGSNFSGTISQTNNKSENPLFVDAAARNYRLTSRSGSRSSGASNVDQGALPYVSDATAGLHGTLWNDLTLSGANTALGDLTVAPGVTLTLSPGATLTFPGTDSIGAGNTANRSELIVLGTLTAIGVSGSPITLTSSATGTTAWAGVVIRAGGSATIANAALDKMGGGIMASVGGTGVITSLTLSNATLSGSEYGLRTAATGSGGTGTFSVTGATFSGITQNALWHAAGDLTVQATSITGGTSGYAIYQSGGTTRFERTLVANNVYGVYIDGGTSSVFDRCTLAYNTSTSPALDTYVSSGTTTVTSSIISHNGGFGVRRGYLGSISVTSTDVWGNSNTFGPPPTAGANTTGSNFTGTITQTNNNSENPLFADASTRNYTLQSTSPCRGRGVGGVDQGAFPYTVGAVTSVTVNPSTATVAAGGVVGFSAQARDAMGNIVSNESFTWTATAAAGTMTSTGILTASCTPGTYTGAITARTANGTTGSASVVINLGAPSQIALTPAGASVKSQATQQYTGVVRDSCNNALTGQTITWGSNATAGTITSGGLFTASCTRGSYPTGITATAGSLTSSTAVSVVAGDPAAIGITPLTVSVAAGTTQQFAASVADGCGNTVSSTVSWSTSVTGGSINTTGLFTAGQTNGTFTTGVTATAGTRTASAEVTVTGGSGTTVASVTVAPVSASLQPNATQTFTATARDGSGTVLTGLPVTWAVTAGGGTITQGGVFTAGTAAATFTDTISATIGGVTGRASVTVQPAAVSTVVVAPSTVTLAPAGTTTFNATAKDAFNNVVSGSVTWSASASAGTITQGGVFTAGSAPGNYPASVTATVGSVSGTASVVIQNGALSQLLVAPAATQLAAGSTVAFSASGRDSSGGTVAVTPVWTVVAGGGTISSPGVFTAGTAAGTFANTVRAEANGLTAFASVSVTPGPVLSVAVTPVTATVQANGSQQFTAEARDAFNNVVPTGFAWTAQAAAGSITQGGFFTAGSSAGSFPNSVTAAVGSITGFASVTVTGSGTGGGGGGATGGGGGATGGGGGSDMDGGTGGGGGSDQDGGTGGGSAGGGSGGGGGSIFGGGAGGGGGGSDVKPSGCGCATADGAFPLLALGLLALSRRRSRR